ncbi:Glycyl-tRNA synthetase beta chain [Granulibacter bethesdensis]|uniref:Glycine--tRNA ligase beta subunit n=1 Tax=Granulibacter bethesdensis TaxID=364410 RepID=A0AAN0RFC7_9PROT|nr:glycine--tRNA ligase subunit beta [Granulibacter bethesdensis]AHJ63994.1 Glycyl-tRNA synthetase beta chain [Granulibacter bethesdensis]
MPELLLELFSEEIPARMQVKAGEDLVRLAGEALADLSPRDLRWHVGPRRLALTATVEAGVPARSGNERGPRIGAPEQALAGFLRKHGADRSALREEGDYWVLDTSSPGREAAALIAEVIPALLWKFPWPKSMRWGGSSLFTWVRPLRRILCQLDGAVVPFSLAQGDDDGHGLRSGDETEGHRFLSPGAVKVRGIAEWQAALAGRHVVLDIEERRRRVAEGIARVAAAHGLTVVDDPGLVDEVAGLVEWPVPLLGRIDDQYMSLPAEVMQVSMRVNQRYFALRDAEGKAAPYFAFIANIEATDQGRAITAGNERVLRARFADARHFWDQDRKEPLASRLAVLERVTYHAKLGSQAALVARLRRLAREIAPLVGADARDADGAALLAKADLTTGMVGEFPELQGVMGRYYALHDGESPWIADAIRDHYAPKGPSDPVPDAPVSIAVALADKIDRLAMFFSIGEAPTGSGDPFALRRAALGIIRIIRENGLRLPLGRLFAFASDEAPVADLLAFMAERLRVQLRAEGARHDVLAAVFAVHADDTAEGAGDIVRLLARADAVAALLVSEDGANLLAAYKRAANILRIEDRKDGPHQGTPDESLLEVPEERALAEALQEAEPAVMAALDAEDDATAMASLARLRGPLDAFFDQVTVNAEEPALRRNRLRLLSRLRDTMNRVADFSRIEG